MPAIHDDTDRALIGRAADRLSREPEFLGYHLTDYCTRTGRTLAELAEALGCSLDTLTDLRLCFHPRPDQEAADCIHLEARFGLAPDSLWTLWQGLQDLLAEEAAGIDAMLEEEARFFSTEVPDSWFVTAAPLAAGCPPHPEDPFAGE